MTFVMIAKEFSSIRQENHGRGACRGQPRAGAPGWQKYTDGKWEIRMETVGEETITVPSKRTQRKRHWFAYLAERFDSALSDYENWYSIWVTHNQ
jgi:hypothetical protein